MQQATVEASGEALRGPILGAWRGTIEFVKFFSQGYPVSNGIAVGYDRLVLSLATVQND